MNDSATDRSMLAVGIQDPGHLGAVDLPLDPGSSVAGRAVLEREAPLVAVWDRVRASGLLFPIVVGVVSRVYSIVLIFFAYGSRSGELARLTKETSPLVAWDAQWYLHIATTGYHAYPLQVGPNGGHHDFAFYPAWPMLIKALTVTGFSPAQVAVGAANVLFVVALAVIFLVLVESFGGDVARRAVLLLAVSPAAYVFSMGYSEPLFLLLAGLYFLSRTRNLGPVVAVATMLARLTGLAIGAAAAVAWLRDRTSWRHAFATIGVLATFGLWWLFLWWLTGRPMAWFQGSASWTTTYGLGGILTAVTDQQPEQIARIAVIVGLIAASVLLLRKHLELGVYSVVALVLSLVGAPVVSMPRHATAVFPAYAAVGERLGHRGTVLLAVGLAGLQAWFVWMVFTGWNPAAP